MKFKNLLNYLNPGYHLRRLREDLELTRKALKFRKAHPDAHGMKPEDLLRGRLTATFFISGPFGMVAVPLGYWVQLKLNHVWGIVATIFITMVVTSVAYQVFWWIDNKKLYAHLPTAFDKLKELERDMWPVHWTGIRTGLILGLMSSLWIVGLVVAGFQLLAPKLAAVIPMNLFLVITEFLVIQGPFLRIMGDFFDRHSKRLAVKYESILTSA